MMLVMVTLFSLNTSGQTYLNKENPFPQNVRDAVESHIEYGRYAKAKAVIVFWERLKGSSNDGNLYRAMISGFQGNKEVALKEVGQVQNYTPLASKVKFMIHLKFGLKWSLKEDDHYMKNMDKLRKIVSLWPDDHHKNNAETTLRNLRQSEEFLNDKDAYMHPENVRMMTETIKSELKFWWPQEESGEKKNWKSDCQYGAHHYLLHQAQIYRDGGECKDAWMIYQFLRKANPDNTNVLTNMAILAGRAGYHHLELDLNFRAINIKGANDQSVNLAYVNSFTTLANNFFHVDLDNLTATGHQQIDICFTMWQRHESSVGFKSDEIRERGEILVQIIDIVKSMEELGEKKKQGTNVSMELKSVMESEKEMREDMFSSDNGVCKTELPANVAKLEAKAKANGNPWKVLVAGN